MLGQSCAVLGQFAFLGEAGSKAELYGKDGAMVKVIKWEFISLAVVPNTVKMCAGVITVIRSCANHH